MEININDVAERYAMDGAIKDILRTSGVDYTGDRLDMDGKLVPDTPTAAARRIAARGYISEAGIAQLKQIGIEV